MNKRLLLDIISGVILGVLVLVPPFVFLNKHKEHQTVVYDCSLAEISPDFPPEVKNECRKRFQK